MIVEYDYKPYVHHLTQTGTFSYTPPGNGNNKGFIYIAGLDSTTGVPILPTVTCLTPDKSEIVLNIMQLNQLSISAESGSFNDMFLQFKRMFSTGSISTNISFLPDITSTSTASGSYFFPITYRKLNFNITSIDLKPIIITLY